MSNNFNSNIPNLILMVKPKSFGFNVETAASNSFQNEIKVDNLQAIVEKEFDKMVHLLQSKNIDVKVMEDVEENLPDSIFPNNWISQISNKYLVVYPMLTKNRRREIRTDIIDWVISRVKVPNFIDLTPTIEENLFLEGTGSIVFDHSEKKAFACISPRTSLKLLNELCEQIAYKAVSFESKDELGKQIYHTNVMMSIGHKVAIVCLDSISDIEERENLINEIELSGKEIIDISYAQMNAFAGNAFEIASKTGEIFLVLSEAAIKALAAAQLNKLEKHTHILSVSIPTIEKIGGGSVRCMMAGLFNYPK